MTIEIRQLDSTWNPEFIAAIKRHYTKSNGPPPGKKMAWEIIEDGKIVGWIGVGEPSYKLAPRRKLGLWDARPLPKTVSLFIYRLEGPRVAKASMILRQFHKQAGLDWKDRYGWEPDHWETMVGQGDPGNPGACFKKAGYRSLGETTGRSARRPPGHTHGARVWGQSTPKLVLYKGPLHRLSEADFAEGTKIMSTIKQLQSDAVKSFRSAFRYLHQGKDLKASEAVAKSRAKVAEILARYTDDEYEVLDIAMWISDTVYEGWGEPPTVAELKALIKEGLEDS